MGQGREVELYVDLGERRSGTHTFGMRMELHGVRAELSACGAREARREKKSEGRGRRSGRNRSAPGRPCGRGVGRTGSTGSNATASLLPGERETPEAAAIWAGTDLKKPPTFPIFVVNTQREHTPRRVRARTTKTEGLC